MTILLSILILALLVIVVVQIGKVTELASAIRGEEDAQRESDYWNSRLGVVFMVIFLAATILSAFYYKNWMLGFGPHQAASEHGSSVDTMFAITLFFTGIVFVITHIALFWFAYKYRYNPNRKAIFNAHDNRLEIVWTIVPAIVMTILVVYGLDAWNKVMADVGPDDDFIEIEATGMQFAWLLRYPGEDGELGARDYRRITGTNPLGQIWTDEANLDDFQPTDIVLPVDKKVRVRITARDVLHNFFLPHFRVKMDAVPGMPTYFVFTPTKTTEEYREELKKYSEYRVPADPDDPEGPEKWEVFDYELACAELCGNGHFSMRKTVRIVSEEEYESWLDEQSSYYLSTIRNSDDDPFAGQLIMAEVEASVDDFNSAYDFLASMDTDALADIDKDNLTETVVVDGFFLPDESELKDENAISVLEKVSSKLNDIPAMNIHLKSESENQQINYNRVQSVKNYLIRNGINMGKIDVNASSPEENAQTEI
jgi:cytochrome c oxidase subunit 2